MQLCLNKPITNDLCVQLSRGSKDKLMVEAELSGSDYRLPTGQR